MSNNSSIIQYKKSPGGKLKDLLQKLIPFDNGLERENFVSNIDDMLKSDAEFEYVVYDSCINYLVRRLITTAAYIKKKYLTDLYTSGRYIVELRSFLQNETRFDKTRIEEILVLLQECLDTKATHVSSRTKMHY